MTMIRCFAVLMLFAMSFTSRAADGLTHYIEPGSKLPFSSAVKAGRSVYLSGQIGLSATEPNDFSSQARRAMDHVAAEAKLAGLSMDDVAQCLVMIKDMSNWPAFNRIYAGYFSAGHYPARSALGATALAMGAAVEVQCTAYASS